MTWLKLDDGFADHPKIDGLSDGAFRLHVAGMLYAARHLTDGAIPARAVPRLTPHYSDEDLVELVDVGLWHDTGAGFEVHDFLEWNPSAEEAKAKRKARQEAGRKGGIASGRTRSKPPGEANATANGEANAQADRRTPSRPVPSRPSSSSKPPPTSSAATAPALEEEEDVEVEEAHPTLLLAAEVLSELSLRRRSTDAPPILNRARWMKAAVGDRITQHAERAAEILTRDPAIDFVDLALALEPEASSIAAELRAAPARCEPECPQCAGSLWIEADHGGVVRCPRSDR